MDSTQDTQDHIAKVQARLYEVTSRLAVRAEQHDMSKLYEPEKSGYDLLLSEGRGSPIVEAAIQHHYQHNSHHPEHHPNGIAGMSLLDLIEMIADWKAASARHNQPSIAPFLLNNKARWQIDDQLYSILENTVRELGW